MLKTWACFIGWDLQKVQRLVCWYLYFFFLDGKNVVWFDQCGTQKRKCLQQFGLRNLNRLDDWVDPKSQQIEWSKRQINPSTRIERFRNVMKHIIKSRPIFDWFIIFEFFLNLKLMRLSWVEYHCVCNSLKETLDWWRFEEQIGQMEKCWEI